MPTMGHREYAGGILGNTASPTLVKSQGRLSLLSKESPNGMSYWVLIDYGEVTEEKLFPTPNRKARDGSQHYTTNASEAFAQFEELAAMYGGIATDASGIDPQKSGSHEELDEMLLSMSELPEDITVELQRRGMASTGNPKRVLDLKFSTGLITRVLGPRTDALRLARIHYESFSKDMRIGALRDMRPRVAAKYLTGELLSSMLMSDRVKREAFILQRRQGTIPDLTQLSQYLEEQPTVAAMPLVAFRVRFVDQNGNEISGLPYEASVRGVLNFKEAFDKTEGGAKPGNFSSGTLLTEQGMSDMQSTDTSNGAVVEDWTGRSLSPNYEYHLLYPYRVRSKGGTPRGTVKISITTPRNTNSTSDWGNNRLKVYEQVSNASEKRGDTMVNAAPKMLLYSHNYKFDDGGEAERITVTVPVYIEPLPMHLVESPPGSGNIVSVWSITDDSGAIPNHQKSTITFTVLRPKASEKWEEADEILPDTRSGYRDKYLQYDEFTSPQGRAAYREAEREASPVRGIKFMLQPDANNTWESAKSPIYMEPDGFGQMTAELVPGRYQLKMLIEIKADGTTGMRMITSSRDPEHKVATRYDALSEDVQAAVLAKYPSATIKRWTRFVPETIDFGVIESPAAFYYRKTTEEDTTPVGVVGVKLLKSGSVRDTGSSRFRKFELKSRVPALLPGKEPENGSIYELLGVEYPAIDDGWPGASTETDERIFDTVTLLLSPDSSIDLSMLSAYEQRYEAERDQGSGSGTPRLQVPPVGSRIAYMGYWIEHAWFDTAIGPELQNLEAAFTGAVHSYDMGKLETPFWEEGVMRLLCYYPQSGVMRRKMTAEAQRVEQINAQAVSAATFYPRWNNQQASMDRIYYFQVEAGPEGAILSGRWCPLEIIGEGNGDDFIPGFTDMCFEQILEEIRRGAGPMKNFLEPNITMPKWNQFWSTTFDGWLFGGNDGESPGGSPYGPIITPTERYDNFFPQTVTTNAVVTVGGQPAETHTVTQSSSAGPGTYGTLGSILGINKEGKKGTNVNFMNEGGNNMDDIIYAPQPSYNGDDDTTYGFIGGE